MIIRLPTSVPIFSRANEERESREGFGVRQRHWVTVGALQPREKISNLISKAIFHRHGILGKSFWLRDSRSSSSAVSSSAVQPTLRKKNNDFTFFCPKVSISKTGHQKHPHVSLMCDHVTNSTSTICSTDTGLVED